MIPSSSIVSDLIQAYHYRIDPHLSLELKRWLTPKELKLYQAMTSAERRLNYLHGRYFIKTVMARDYGVKNPRLRIQPSGKPKLKGFEISLSHSHGEMVLAVSRSTPLGIDIERKPFSHQFKRIAEKYFHPLELDFINSDSTQDLQYQNFCLLWSLKEATVKAYDGRIDQEILGIVFDLKENKVYDLPKFNTHRFYLNREQNIAIAALSEAVYFEQKILKF